jgi:hypothetical protein
MFVLTSGVHRVSTIRTTGQSCPDENKTSTAHLALNKVKNTE